MTGSDGQFQAPKTVSQAAVYLGVSERSVRRYIRAGKLGTLELSGQTRIQPGDLDRLAVEIGSATVMSGSGVATPDPTAEVLRDVIRRQDEEISHLRTMLERVMLMLPANTTSTTPTAKIEPWLKWVIIGGAALALLMMIFSYVLWPWLMTRPM